MHHVPLRRVFLVWLTGALLAAAAGCSSNPKTSQQVYDETQRALINASPGDVVEIPAGTWELENTLSLADVNNVTLRGAGRGKTILNFDKQQGGAEGVMVQNADSVTLEAFTVQNTGGDGVKVIGSDHAVLRNLGVEWTAGADTANGGYGLYPVSLSDITVANNDVRGASDGGIYVGQARGGIVKGNHTEDNVQGFAIENCIDLKITGNTAVGNTAGIAVYNLPDLPLSRGHGIEVYGNTVRNNNHPNFGAEGAIVHTVPAGTGMFVLSGVNVDIHDNEISGHRTTGTGVISYELTGRPVNDDDYYPFSRGVKIHDNTYTDNGGKALPDTTRRLGKLIAHLFKNNPPEILYDGIVDPKLAQAEGDGTVAPENGLCIAGNGNAQFANINRPSGFQNVISKKAPYACAEGGSEKKTPATADARNASPTAANAK